MRSFPLGVKPHVFVHIAEKNEEPPSCRTWFRLFHLTIKTPEETIGLLVYPAQVEINAISCRREIKSVFLGREFKKGGEKGTSFLIIYDYNRIAIYKGGHRAPEACRGESLHMQHHDPLHTKQMKAAPTLSPARTYSPCPFPWPIFFPFVIRPRTQRRVKAIKVPPTQPELLQPMSNGATPTKMQVPLFFSEVVALGGMTVLPAIVE